MLPEPFEGRSNQGQVDFIRIINIKSKGNFGPVEKRYSNVMIEMLQEAIVGHFLDGEGTGGGEAAGPGPSKNHPISIQRARGPFGVIGKAFGSKI